MKDRPRLDFISYLWLLYQSGMVAMGHAVNPVTGRREASLEEASSIIELFEMLSDKTSGNRTSQEDEALTSILRNLRAGYSEMSTGKPGEPGEGSDVH